MTKVLQLFYIKIISFFAKIKKYKNRFMIFGA